jgi:predicted DNA-binding transcriptional regulator AlpA
MAYPQGEPKADELLDEKEAAAILDVNVGTLQVWRCTRRYKLAYVKVGRNIRYRRSAITAFIESRTVTA